MLARQVAAAGFVLDFIVYVLDRAGFLRVPPQQPVPGPFQIRADQGGLAFVEFLLFYTMRQSPQCSQSRQVTGSGPGGAGVGSTAANTSGSIPCSSQRASVRSVSRSCRIFSSSSGSE